MADSLDSKTAVAGVVGLSVRGVATYYAYREFGIIGGIAGWFLSRFIATPIENMITPEPTEGP